MKMGKKLCEIFQFGLCGLVYLWFINLNFSEKITDNGLYLHLDATERQYKVRKLVLLALKSIFEFQFSTLPPNLMYVCNVWLFTPSINHLHDFIC